MKTFMNNIKLEMKKISWPTKEKLIKDVRTSALIALILILLIALVDSTFSFMITSLITHIS